MEENIIDSYSENNANAAVALYNVYRTAGQTITGNGKKIVKAYFYLSKVGNPTGNMVYRIYAMTGTHGSSGMPTGDVLAESAAKDISEIGSNYELVGLDFIGENQIVLEDGVNYCLVAHSPNGSTTHYLKFAVDTSSPTHDGNHCYYGYGYWTTESGKDSIFYLVGDDGPQVKNGSGFFLLFN